jgi:hypothetical protein
MVAMPFLGARGAPCHVNVSIVAFRQRLPGDIGVTVWVRRKSFQIIIISSASVARCITSHRRITIPQWVVVVAGPGVRFPNTEMFASIALHRR